VVAGNVAEPVAATGVAYKNVAVAVAVHKFVVVAE
jgi:hypothetical protein